MGQRANYVIKSQTGFSLYYSHWGANNLDFDLIWGPEHARELIESQVLTEDWLDNIWCEGAVLIDIENKFLLWFGGEEIAYNVAERKIFQRLLRTAWKGWKVEWAAHGLQDIVDSLGLSRELVSSTPPEDLAPTDWTKKVDDYSFDTLVSIKEKSHTRIAISDFDPAEIIRRKLDLMNDEGIWYQSLNLTSIPIGGVHIDTQESKFYYWTAKPEPHIASQLRDLPGEWEALRVTNDLWTHDSMLPSLKVEWPSEQDYAKRQFEMYLKRDIYDKKTFVNKTLNQFKTEGKNVSNVNKYIYDYEQINPTVDRREYLNRILQASGITKLN